MKILVVSDLHICAQTDLDKFGWDDEMFMSKLISMKNKYGLEKVIINGDIYELFFFDMSHIYEHHSALVDFIQKTDWIVPLKGNHDLFTKNDSVIIIDNVLIEHGNKADFYGDESKASFNNFINKFLDRTFIVNFKLFRKMYLDHYVKGVRLMDVLGAKNPEVNLAYAKKILKRYDMVVLGHTHIQQKLLIDGKTYINTGTCSTKRFEGVVIDTQTKEVEMVRE